METQPGDGWKQVLLYVGHAEVGEPALLDVLEAVQHEGEVGGVGGVDVELARAQAVVRPSLQVEVVQLRSQKASPHHLTTFRPLVVTPYSLGILSPGSRGSDFILKTDLSILWRRSLLSSPPGRKVRR